MLITNLICSIRTYAKYIVAKPELLGLIIEALVRQVKTEVNESTKVAQKNMIIIKCWNVIRSIGENYVYIPYFDEIEAKLLPLYDFMEAPEKITFADEIIGLMSSMIKHLKKVSKIKWILVSTFPKIFEKNKHMFHELFPAMNLVIVYGTEDLKSEPKLIDMVNLVKYLIFLLISCIALVY